MNCYHFRSRTTKFRPRPGKSEASGLSRARRLHFVIRVPPNKLEDHRMSEASITLSTETLGIAGRLHARAYSTALTTSWSNRTRACPCEPKFSPIQKMALLRASKHPKAYKNTLEEEEKGGRRLRSKELLEESRLIHLRSRIHHQD
ncbi:hypothetical protein F383_24547 [Gossypium arboreum]|uniref:Uncharacterized protein n=1 Tax=Gossypium arboreum TaxID=29729 RepID=A0A0B0MJF8_GOSAR|nr:hypothetical protein F383_23871 [Gossypium arboreum]KHG02455.1 hypothetical protein F383_24547 [Gossypium arboreum]